MFPYLLLGSCESTCTVYYLHAQCIIVLMNTFLLTSETVTFVDKLFRCLESESYLNRDETPPPSPAESQPAQSNERSVGRQQSEDIRQKEVNTIAYSIAGNLVKK